MPQQKKNNNNSSCSLGFIKIQAPLISFYFSNPQSMLHEEFKFTTIKNSPDKCPGTIIQKSPFLNPLSTRFGFHVVNFE